MFHKHILLHFLFYNKIGTNKIIHVETLKLLKLIKNSFRKKAGKNLKHDRANVIQIWHKSASGSKGPRSSARRVSCVDPRL